MTTSGGFRVQRRQHLGWISYTSLPPVISVAHGIFAVALGFGFRFFPIR